ncbi:MAG: aminotransferase class V-fold PLP-dependent enzyme [Leptolyngbya sp. PLA3]|nr:MAG: aminotransferase class V-fold PLP-dependent enzyme [Cyanobacteria bacterium CYA]MCE7969130.1 aminotransferase class V-fold PLP-dependent enzyme [Leptolyngbya sp. PL-A3]
MHLPSPSPLAAAWALDPDVVFLNNGSYGACPRAVMQRRQQLLERSEAEPIRFMLHEAPDLIDRARRVLGRLLNAEPSDLVFVPNVTIAVATVAANLKLQPGDEVLVNTHEYPACLAIFERLCVQTGARLVFADLPFPVPSEEAAYQAVISKATDRTRLCLLSHVTSPSAMILPAARIVATLRQRGIETLVDGAHAPGFCDLDIPAINPAYYTANCHKWLGSPRGSGFLYVRRDLQDGFRPLALSVYSKKPPSGRPFFNVEFDFIGTQDYTPIMCIADAIEHMPTLIGSDWAGVRARNHALALRARDLLCDRLGIDAPVPDDMLGSMATIPIPTPPATWNPGPTRYHDALQDRLVSKHRIQVPLWFIADETGRPRIRFVRISAQLFNAIEQYEYLAHCLLGELAAERA